ncbi:MAG TPA: hypothetical protein VJU60_11650 [Thermoleophilaceae bacterium]|nr:hypothetical protein [Thermoleophilaceae bacterium]
MPSRRALALPLVLGLAFALAVFVSACGGGSGSNDKSATQLLNTAFHQPIKSADVNFNLQVQVNGVQSLSEPISFKFSGPYVNNGPGKLPSMDLSASIVGGGQSVPFGLTSTGDDFFVKVRGQAYDVGKQTVARLNQQLAQQKAQNKQKTTSLSELGIHPSTWLSGAKNAGDSTVDGTPVTHISADLDVSKVLDDLNSLVQKAPTSSLNGASKPPQLSEQQKSEIEQVVKNPHIDVYVAKSDNTVRRIATSLNISVPKDQQSKVNGATGGTLQLSIDLANVGQAKHITAPANAKPIADLAGQLNALGGSLGATSGGSGGSSSAPPSSGTTGSSSSPTAKQFQDYAKCLQKAGSNNASALSKCASILK